MTLSSTLKQWSHGVRLYIGIAIVLYTLESWWWTKQTIGSAQLSNIRLEELYAWTAIGLLTAALSIGPMCAIWRNIPGKYLLFDARRLLGIGAAWFSVLHIAISYGALFKFANPLSLPSNYQRAFVIGVIAAIILLAMAFTSFDKAFHGMGKWWFRLHRFVYVAAVLSLLHIFLIGAHAAATIELTILTIATIAIVAMHTCILYMRRASATFWQLTTLPLMVIALAITLSFGYSHHSPTASVSTDHETMSHSSHMDGMHGMEMH